jgi:hypothetical protein
MKKGNSVSVIGNYQDDDEATAIDGIWGTYQACLDEKKRVTPNGKPQTLDFSFMVKEKNGTIIQYSLRRKAA